MWYVCSFSLPLSLKHTHICLNLLNCLVIINKSAQLNILMFFPHSSWIIFIYRCCKHYKSPTFHLLIASSFLTRFHYYCIQQYVYTVVKWCILNITVMFPIPQVPWSFVQISLKGVIAYISRKLFFANKRGRVLPALFSPMYFYIKYQYDDIISRVGALILQP